jgi:hypothetical protein
LIYEIHTSYLSLAMQHMNDTTLFIGLYPNIEKLGRMYDAIPAVHGENDDSCGSELLRLAASGT